MQFAATFINDLVMNNDVLQGFDVSTCVQGV